MLAVFKCGSHINTLYQSNTNTSFLILQPWFSFSATPTSWLTKKMGPYLLSRLYLLPLLLQLNFTYINKIQQCWLHSSAYSSAGLANFFLHQQTSKGFENSKEGPDKASKRWDWMEGGRGVEDGRGRAGKKKKSRVWSSGLFSTEACDTGPLNKCSVCCSALQRNW